MVILGEETQVTIGIVNREQEVTDYIIMIYIEEQNVEEVGTITLAHEQKWEQLVSFVPTKVGENQEVEFMLFQIGEIEACEIVHFWIDVVEAD